MADDTKSRCGMAEDADGPGKTSEFGQHKPGKDEQREATSCVVEWETLGLGTAQEQSAVGPSKGCQDLGSRKP